MADDATGNLRTEYPLRTLDESGVHPDPFVQFDRWFKEAMTIQSREPNAMVLATATRDGKPSVRVVLMKGFDERGFLFFTNYESRKSAELRENPNAALLFHWSELEREVRLEGPVERAPQAECEEYFRSRPREAQLGAWASRQSEVIPDRTVLEQKVAELKARFGDGPISLPPFWGGFRLRPHMFEFWQGRPNRLHDRIRSRLDAKGWVIDRLSP
jgi:pyridoxamine 5'-phosphate oxidase